MSSITNLQSDFLPNLISLVAIFMNERLCAPILNPLRRVIPLLGGIDFSPLVALLALQVVTIVLGNLQMRMLT